MPMVTIPAPDTGAFAAYLALPAHGTGPGVVVIQEIFGVNQGMRDIADWYAARGFVALCPEVDVASQGDTIEHARANLQEAVELFFESASETEINERLHGEVYVTTLEVAIG